MISKAFTEKHSFSIELKESNNKTYFEIIATDLIKNTKSSITNLNFIISELIEPIVQLKDYETLIVVNKNGGIKIFEEAIKLFKDTEWINLLELKLQEDKEIGGWS